MEDILGSYRKPINLQYAFIDECGNFGFDFEKDGVSTHFIVTAIIVEENKIPQLEDEIDSIRKKHFQTGEMKSQKVGKNDLRRIKILEEINKLDFHVFALVVDKREIYKDSGLYYKKSYIKYLNGIVHNELYTAFPKLQMIADQHGHKEFMDEFIRYVDNHHQPSLFEIYDFSFSNSKSTILVQLADFICGTIAKGFEDTQISDKYSVFMNLLRDKIIRIKKWPEKNEDYLVNFSVYKRITYNEIILMQGIRLANEFIERFENSSKLEIQEQVIFLKYLKSMLLSQKPDRYISSKEIMTNMTYITKRNYSNHYFKTKIVAKLRDEGVIIASSPQGYKLPISEKELYDFTNQSNSMIMPMLNRLKKCREQILMATKNELDLFAKSEYQHLKRYFDSENYNYKE